MGKTGLFAIAALCCVCAWAVSAGASAVITTGRLGNVSAPGENLSFQVTPDTAVSLPAEWRVVDSRNLVLSSGKLADGRELRLTAAPDWEGRFLRLCIGETQLPFAILPERTTAAGGDTRFGGWVGFSSPEKMFQSALRIGVSTSYPYWQIRENNIRFAKKYGFKITNNYSSGPWGCNFAFLKGIPDQARFDDWVKELESYHRVNKGLVSDVSSLCGEHAMVTDMRMRVPALLQLHQAYYKTVKSVDPDCRVYMGMFMRRNDLKEMLAGLSPRQFEFDGVSYDLAGYGVYAIERLLKEDIEVMTNWGMRRPQWICEVWASSADEEKKANELVQLYAMAFGLGVKEIDWHSMWYSLPECSWLTYRAFKEQALFRNSNYELTPAAIAHYQLFRRLGHAQPRGEISSNFNLAAYQFERDGRYITALWTRAFPTFVSLTTSSRKVVLYDYMGDESVILEPSEGKISLGLSEQVVFLESDKPVAVEGVEKETMPIYGLDAAKSNAPPSAVELSGFYGSRPGDQLRVVNPPSGVTSGAYPATALLTRAGKTVGWTRIVVPVKK